MFIKLHQIYTFVFKLKNNTFNCLLFNKFFQYSSETIQVQADSNSIHGNALLVFLLFNLPANAILVMLLSVRTLGIQFKIILSIFIILQLVFLFVVHLFYAMIGRKFHQPAKKIIAISITHSLNQFSNTFKRKVRFNLKFKLHRYIEQFHGSKLGYYYGKWGQCTFSSFGKEIFIYCKLLIFSYKLFQQTFGEIPNK